MDLSWREFCYFIKKQNMNGVKNMVERGIFDVPPKYPYGKGVPLQVAIKTGELDFVKILVENGKIPIEAIHMAIVSHRNDLDMMKFLISRGGDPNQENLYETTYNPLEIASREGYFEIVNFLINDYGVNVRNCRGGLCLHKASYRGYLKIVKILVENGVDINFAGELNSPCKKTPLYYSCQKGNLDIVKYLISKGVILDEGIMSPLLISLYRDHEDITILLLNNGYNYERAIRVLEGERATKHMRESREKLENILLKIADEKIKGIAL